MGGYRIFYIDLEKLNLDEQLATIIPQLMMACNDISLANTCLGKYMNKEVKTTRYIWGARMYFIRQQIGHIEEGLKIIDEIRKDSRLLLIVNRMSQHGKERFDKLCGCLDGRDKTWEDYFLKIRHNISFHYNDRNESKLTRNALHDIIKEKKGKKKCTKLKNTVGSVQKMRFQLADEIVYDIVVRKIFGIPYTVDLEKDQTQAYEFLDFCSDIGKAFINFGAEFIKRIGAK
ncbi:MAG: hypothetical protein AB1401_11195 [Thermodesulfobacteriota bacterium]